jgi:chromosome segregation ATPase
LKNSSDQVTDLCKKSEQIEENLTNKEQEIINLGTLIKSKQKEIENKGVEVQNLSLTEKEKTKLEKEISNLITQLNNLQNQLAEKDKELQNLRQENNQLAVECLNYLGLFKSFRAKQKQITELEEILTKKIPSKEELTEFRQLQKEFTPLETEVENLIFNEQQQANLIQRLNLQNNQVDSITSEINNKFGIISPEKTLTNLEEKAKKTIDECSERTVRTILLSSNSELKSLKNVYDLATSPDQERIKKMITFLDAKQTFVAARQATIKRLQDCCDKLEYYVNCG